MKNWNWFINLTVIASLIILTFLMGCAETEREMRFPDRELPESVTIVIEDVPNGTTLNLAISTDYNELMDNYGNNVIIHNREEKNVVTEDYSKTIIFDSEEPNISVKLTCTEIESKNENSSNSVRLIVQFNGEGNFDKGNHDQRPPIALGTSMSLQSAFSRYDGTSKSWQYTPPD